MKHLFSLIRRLFLIVPLAVTASAAEERVNQQLDASPGGKIVVDVDFGKIDLTAGADDKVTMEAYRRVDFHDEAKEKQYLSAAPVTLTKEGNTITVRSRSSQRESFWDMGHSRTDGRYAIRVPKNFQADLHTGGDGISASELSGDFRAETSGGDLKMTHLQGAVSGRTSGGSIEMNGCNGPIEIETSGGEITVAESNGTLHARTSGGGIEVRNFTGDTEVKTSGGDLALQKIGGRIIGKTSGGAISASVAGSTVNEIKLETSGGGIDLALPASATVDINAETSAGSVSSNLPLTLISADQDHLRGKLNGGGKSVLLRTSAGNINISAKSAETAAR